MLGDWGFGSLSNLWSFGMDWATDLEWCAPTKREVQLRTGCWIAAYRGALFEVARSTVSICLWAVVGLGWDACGNSATSFSFNVEAGSAE